MGTEQQPPWRSVRPTLAAAALVGLVFTSLAVDPAGLAPFGPARWALVPTFALAAGAAASARRFAVVRLPTLAWAAFLLAVAIAAAAGLDPLYAWLGTPERRFGAATWLLCAVAFLAAHTVPRRDHRVLAGAVAVTAGLIGAWTVAELAGWEPVRLVGVGDRPVGPFGSSAYLGAAAVLLGPVAAGLAAERRSRWAALAAALAGVALVASGARAAWVGAAVAGLVVVVRSVDRRRAAALLVCGLVVGVALAAATGVLGRAGDVATSDAGGARGRLDEWRVAARVIADHPVTGVGPEGYRIAFGAAVDDAYEEAHGRTPLPDRAHSAPLDVLASTGAPGLLAYLALVTLTGRIVLRALRRGSALDAGLAAGLVAYAVQSLFLFPIAELEPVVWALAGLAVARAGRDRERVSVRVPRVVPGVLAVGAALALVAGGFDVVADHRAKHILAGAPADADGAADLRPDAVRYHLVESRARESSGDVDGAIGAVDDALVVSPLDPVARSEHARLLLDRARRSHDGHDLDVARDALESLAHDDPRNAAALLRLGVARALDDDAAGAERAWIAAERLAPASAAASTNLAVAYAEQGRDDDARAAARRAIARDPSAARARSVLDQLDGT